MNKKNKLDIDLGESIIELDDIPSSMKKALIDIAGDIDNKTINKPIEDKTEVITLGSAAIKIKRKENLIRGQFMIEPSINDWLIQFVKPYKEKGYSDVTTSKIVNAILKERIKEISKELVKK